MHIVIKKKVEVANLKTFVIDITTKTVKRSQYV